MKLGLFVPNLLSWSGNKLIIGGLERYAWALINLIQDMGWEVEIHQNGNSDWEREVDGVKIIGHGVAQFSLEAVVEEINSCCEKVLYGSLLQSPMYYKKDSIIISHGVWWDGKNYSLETREKMFLLCGEALKQVKLMISCDYNFLNVMRSYSPELSSKIRVIPNFVKLEDFDFDVNENLRLTDEKVRILYPRRIDYCRGIDIFIKIANNLLKHEKNIEILMAIDRNNIEYNEIIEPFLQQERVKEINANFEQMPAIYNKADIVVIPSRYSEGTSFSCIEAMASGKVIVATDVGGLTNLIIDGYNGILVPPTSERIENAIKFLIHDPRSRELLGKRARQTAKAFTLERWKKEWKAYLQTIYS